MKYILLLIAIITMTANIIITLQIIRLRKKIQIMKAPAQKEQLIFYLPKKNYSGADTMATNECADTVLMKQ